MDLIVLDIFLKDLLWIAREGLKAPLPKPWKACRTDPGGEGQPEQVYYFNFDTGESIWEHPCDIKVLFHAYFSADEFLVLCQTRRPHIICLKLLCVLSSGYPACKLHTLTCLLVSTTVPGRESGERKTKHNYPVICVTQANFLSKHSSPVHMSCRLLAET